TGFALGPQTLDYDGVLTFEQFRVTSDLIRFRTDTGLSAAVTISASRAVLKPGAPIFTAVFTSLSATIDLDSGSAEFRLSAAAMNATIGGAASLTLQNVELYLGNAPNTPLFSARTAVATASLLGDIKLT